MKKFSKGISILLAICMIIAMVPAAFAADEATPVTVSMLASNFTTSGINFGGNGGVTDTSGYTITWNDDSAVFVREESSIGYFRQVYGLVDGKKPIFAFPAGHYTTAQFTFKTKIPADGHYAVSLIPILSQVGGTYGVWVNEQYAGSVNGWNGIAGTSGWTSTTTAGAEVTLNTLKLEADTDGYVKIKLKNLSTVSDTTIADSYKDAYVVPMAFQEFKLTPVEVVTCTGVTEDITDKDLYVGKTVDFEVSANMSDNSTFFFDSADTTTNNITAAVTAGDSVELSEVAIGADGNLHGKIKGIAAAESTITVTVKLGEDTTTHEIKVTPKVLSPVITTVSMRDRGLDYSKPTEYNMKVTFNSNNGTRPGNGSFSVSKDTIQWLSSSTLDESYALTDYTVNENIEFVADKTTISTLRELILKDAASGATTNYGTYNWPIGSSTSDVQFTFKTKLADGTYKVSIEPVISMRGCTYGVWVGGQYAGKVDTYEAHTGTWNSNAYAGAAVSLNTLDLTSDSEGWVEVTIKKLSVPAENTSGVASIGFKDITLTPTDDLAVSSLSENISTTDIYVGETYDFAIKAVMNDGQIHKFDTSDTADKITASVSGSAVSLSGMEMQEDGLYGKITGVGEDEKATITVKTTIGGVVVDTKTINVISFATEVKTPETVAVSMVHGGELTTTVDSADRFVFESTDKITWGEGDKIRLDYDKTVITNFREQSTRAKIWYPVINKANADAGFVVKVRASEGTYKVDLENDVSIGGCVYSVTIDGKQVGTIDCSGDSDAWYTPENGSEYNLETVAVTPDEEGWVEISFKYVEDGEKTNVSSDTRLILFSNLTLTPTQKVYVTAETPSGMNNSLITCEGYKVGEIADVAFKSNLVLNANDTETNKFLYWINNSNQQVISEEATLTLSVTSDATISAVYAESGNTRYDYFTSTGQRIASYFGSAPATAPEIPTMVGFATGGEWTAENSYETDDYVAYAPDYTNAAALTFDTTIDGEEVTVTYEEEITVTAEESDFSYWAKGGKAVSFMNSYTFFVWGNEIVEKVCGVSLTAKDRAPQVVLFKNGNDYMLELVACEDVEVIEKGILFAESGTPTIGSAITKAKSNSDKNQFTASSTYSVARAYLVYRDDDSVKVVYSK